jgi:hypothetical protein
VALATNFNLQLRIIVEFKMLVTSMFIVQTQMKKMIVQKENQTGDCSKVGKIMLLFYQIISRE